MCVLSLLTSRPRPSDRAVAVSARAGPMTPPWQFIVDGKLLLRHWKRESGGFLYFDPHHFCVFSGLNKNVKALSAVGLRTWNGRSGAERQGGGNDRETRTGKAYLHSFAVRRKAGRMSTTSGSGSLLGGGVSAALPFTMSLSD